MRIAPAITLSSDERTRLESQARSRSLLGPEWLASPQFTSQHRSSRLAHRSEDRRRYSLADIATLGFAISFMTSASVALADCFLLFFLPVVLWESFINK
jgi:hypothetical protein